MSKFDRIVKIRQKCQKLLKNDLVNQSNLIYRDCQSQKTGKSVKKYPKLLRKTFSKSLSKNTQFIVRNLQISAKDIPRNFQVFA